MGIQTLGAMESRFADIVWSHAPIATGELVALAERDLGWKRTTTYTVLKRLCNRGLFSAKDGTVEVRLSRAVFYAERSRDFIQESFSGSLPAFLAAFTTGERLSASDLAEIRQMIDRMEKEG